MALAALVSLAAAGHPVLASAGAEEDSTSSSIVSVVFAPGAVTVPSAPGQPLSVWVSDEGLRASLQSLGLRAIEPAFADWHPPARPADPGQGAVTRPDPSRPDLSRFLHLHFDTPDAARSAARALSALPSVELAQVIPGGLRTSDFPDDPAFLPSQIWGEDAQWCLVNRGVRPGTNLCGGATAASDLRLLSTWTAYFNDGNRPGVSHRIGNPAVVLGFVDEGILSTHPDLHLLSEFSHDERFTFCPEDDWCGDHGTKMAGLAAMAVGNGVGAAGVCGDCSLIDFRAPFCLCDWCGDPTHNCQTIHPLWYTKIPAALNVPLGLTADGEPRRILALNGSFATLSDAPLEEVEALWTARQAGVLFVAGSADHSLDHPSNVQPANIPFVLGVGGSTWEDRFWDASASCYTGNSGTTIGPGAISVTAPACGPMVSAFPYENPNGGGLYAWTSGQCSGAAALVTGAAGLLQSYARDRSPLKETLTPDDLEGLLVSTARPYAADPTAGATCPEDLCPRSYYGAGIVTVENAAFVLDRADSWRTCFADLSCGCQVAFRPPQFTDSQGRVWREYRVTWSFTLPPRPDAAGAPPDLPRFIAWPLKARSTTLCSYGSAPPARVLTARAGITDCSLEIDRATGSGRLSGSQFTEVKDGVEIPLIPWEDLRMGMTYWAVARPAGCAADTAAGPRSRPRPSISAIGPNPFREGTAVRILVRPSAEATVEVCEVSGRVARILQRGPVFTGAMDVRWDGTEGGGRAVPSGLYWIRVRSEGRVAACPIVRIR